MPNEYDKIFKENIEAVILPIADKLLGIHAEQLEEIPGDLQVGKHPAQDEISTGQRGAR